MSSTAAEWGVADDIRVLRRDGYNAAANRMERLSTTINKAVEMQVILDHLREHGFEGKMARDQFRCLWVAFCIHQGLEVDTNEYDVKMVQLYDTAREVSPGMNINWDSFYCFMCEMLV